MKITHYVKIKKGKGVDYTVKNVKIKNDSFVGVGEVLARYLRDFPDKFEIITVNEYNKRNGIKVKKDESKDKKEDGRNDNHKDTK